MTFSKEPKFTKHNSDGVVTSVALQLLAIRLLPEGGCDYDPRGTAVLLSSGFALTASHVVKDTINNFGITNDGAQFTMVACQVIGNGNTGVLFSIREITLVPNTDLALLRISLYSKPPEWYQHTAAAFSLMIPRIGDRMSAFGYCAPEVKVDPKDIMIDRTPATSVGEVTDVHALSRDKYLAPWPCFTTNARYEGSMSGGPVFNDEGHVCGIISTCMKGHDGLPDYSVVSLLWPLMGVEIQERIDGETDLKKYTIRRLAERGVYHNIIGWEHTDIVKDEEGLTKVLYRLR